jgi:hypothetical protein
MTYSADTLKLPTGVEWKRVVNDVREVMTYDIGTDCFWCRFDTVINGRQFHHIEYQSPNEFNVFVSWEKGDGFIGVGRETAYRLFKALDHSMSAGDLLKNLLKKLGIEP